MITIHDFTTLSSGWTTSKLWWHLRRGGLSSCYAMDEGVQLALPQCTDSNHGISIKTLQGHDQSFQAKRTIRHTIQELTSRCMRADIPKCQWSSRETEFSIPNPVWWMNRLLFVMQCVRAVHAPRCLSSVPRPLILISRLVGHSYDACVLLWRGYVRRVRVSHGGNVYTLVASQMHAQREL